MKNLRYHFPTCYAYSVKEPRELWMKIQESFLPSFPFFHLLLCTFCRILRKELEDIREEVSKMRMENARLSAKVILLLLIGYLIRIF